MFSFHILSPNPLNPISERKGQKLPRLFPVLVFLPFSKYFILFHPLPYHPFPHTHSTPFLLPLFLPKNWAEFPFWCLVCVCVCVQYSRQLFIPLHLAFLVSVALFFVVVHYFNSHCTINFQPTVCTRIFNFLLFTLHFTSSIPHHCSVFCNRFFPPFSHPMRPNSLYTFFCALFFHHPLYIFYLLLHFYSSALMRYLFPFVCPFPHRHHTFSPISFVLDIRLVKHFVAGF